MPVPFFSGCSRSQRCGNDLRQFAEVLGGEAAEKFVVCTICSAQSEPSWAAKSFEAGEVHLAPCCGASSRAGIGGSLRCRVRARAFSYSSRGSAFGQNFCLDDSGGIGGELGIEVPGGPNGSLVHCLGDLKYDARLSRRMDPELIPRRFRLGVLPVGVRQAGIDIHALTADQPIGDPAGDHSREEMPQQRAFPELAMTVLSKMWNGPTTDRSDRGDKPSGRPGIDVPLAMACAARLGLFIALKRLPE